MNHRALFWGAAVAGTLALSSHGWAAETFVCEAGKTMRASTEPPGLIVFGVTAATTPVIAGECATKNGEPLPQGGRIQLHFGDRISQLEQIRSIVQAESGSFTLQVNVDRRTQANTTVSVLSVMDAQGGGQAGGQGGAGQVEDDVIEEDDAANAGGGGGGDPCPAGEATVSIPEANLNKLNIRERPDGEIVDTVREGATVSVVGECGGAAGFAANKNRIWCEIDAPTAGCVRETYLDFGGAAGFAKKRN